MVSFDGHFSLMQHFQAFKKFTKQISIVCPFLFLFFFSFSQYFVLKATFAIFFVYFHFRQYSFQDSCVLLFICCPLQLSLYSCRSSIALLMQFCFTFGMTVPSHFQAIKRQKLAPVMTTPREGSKVPQTVTLVREQQNKGTLLIYNMSN